MIRLSIVLCVGFQAGGCVFNSPFDPPSDVSDGGFTEPPSVDAGAPGPDSAPGQEFVQQVYLKAANPGKDDAFGAAVAIDGDTIVVAATGDDSNAIGINGDDTSNARSNSGAVYVFVKQGDDWVQQAYLKASNPSINDAFGEQIAIQGDTLVVGALHEDSIGKGVNSEQDNDENYNSGAVYVFVRKNGVWSQQAYLKASNSGWQDEFGGSICLDNDTLVVGATKEKGNGNSEDDNSTDFSGAAYVFQRSGDIWQQQAYLKASNPYPLNLFGSSCALSGDRLIIGSPRENSSSGGIDGDQYDLEAQDSGAVYSFTRQGTAWTQEAYIKSVHPQQFDNFGTSVALVGESLVVGIPGRDGALGGVTLYAREQGQWAYQRDLYSTRPGQWLGYKLASSETALIAGNRSSTGLATEIYANEMGDWTSSTILETTDIDYTDHFGDAFAISSNNTIIVGAPREDSRAQGVNGNEQDNSTSDSGAAYVLVPSIANTP